MLDSIFLENSGGGGASGGSASDGLASELRNEGGGSGSGGGGEGDFISAGNRWPREETLALLKIRSDMDQLFRDSILKSPLWDEVSRKLGELGYNRSPKKCREKFENIYKYHKRTKQGSSGRQDGKSYRFFDQLELFDTQFFTPLIPSHIETKTIEPPNFVLPCSYQDCMTEFMAICTSSSTASSSGGGSGKKKKELKDYFEKLMKDILEKQEELQNKFLEALEKYENHRVAREEAWKAQEMARIKRERESLAQERAVLAAKDAAMLAFLQKLSHEMPEALTQILSDKNEIFFEKNVVSLQENSGAGENTCGRSSSRWPKPEIETLIMLKIDLDMKFQDNGPKGRLWEEISSCMKKVGYDRSAKKCKEKWENINKYYKRVKDSNKRRAEDSKTCPYFNMLESLYANKSKKSKDTTTTTTSDSGDGDGIGVGVGDGGGYNLKPEHILMQMMLQQKQPPSMLQSGDGEYGGEIHDNDDFDDEGEGGYQIAG